MKRVQLILTDRQHDWLKVVAEAEEISMSKLVRILLGLHQLPKEQKDCIQHKETPLHNKGFVGEEQKTGTNLLPDDA